MAPDAAALKANSGGGGGRKFERDLRFEMAAGRGQQLSPVAYFWHCLFYF